MTSIKQRLAEILKVENSDEWEVVDSRPEKNLYLVHYTRDADTRRFGELRGVAVDIAAGTIVSKAFGYTPTVVAEQLVPDAQGHLHLTDLDGVNHEVAMATSAIRIGFEATVMMIFKHAGVVYRRTHRRLDPVNSRWFHSPTFADMGIELGLPEDEELFHPDSAYSPYCHIFLMVHPDILVATKAPISSGFLVYLGAQQMWSVETDKCPYKQTTKSGVVWDPNFAEDKRPNAGWIECRLRLPLTQRHLDFTADEPFLYEPTDLTLPQANLHLRRGFYPDIDFSGVDDRLRLGEFVMLYKRNAAGQITGLLRVVSPAYAWREAMRGNEPNLLLQMYRHLNTAVQCTDARDYLEVTPICPNLRLKEVRSQLPVLTWPWLVGTTQPNLAQVDLLMTGKDKRDERYYNMALAFMMAVPLHRQEEVLDCYNQVLAERQSIISWLCGLTPEEILAFPSKSKAHPRAQARAVDIVSTAARWALQTHPRDTGRQRKNNIRNMVNKEEGSSLYRIVQFKAWLDKKAEETLAVQA